jgi:hypothetical protein
VLYTKDKTSLIKYPEGKQETQYIIPNSVIEIDEHAMSNQYLINITIGANVKLKRNSFYDNFVDYYDKGGRKSGTYVKYTDKNWRLQ